MAKKTCYTFIDQIDLESLSVLLLLLFLKHKCGVELKGHKKQRADISIDCNSKEDKPNVEYIYMYIIHTYVYNKMLYIYVYINNLK